MSNLQPLSISQCATLACLLEVTAAKVGNVHRGADFDDMTFLDFVLSATAIGPVLERATDAGVGATADDAICATRRMVSVNTNLGTVLLLAPLAVVPRAQSLKAGIGKVLANLTPGDAAGVYRAIRRARPGGMGKVEQMDVAGEAPDDLRAAMAAAAARDLVAMQYVNDFSEVLDVVVPLLTGGQQAGWSLLESIVYAQVSLLSRYSDSLVARKCGAETADALAGRAAQVLAAGQPGDEAYWEALSDLDFWLRSDGHRRNPGTTADLLAAGLFAALREGCLQPPFPA